VQYHFEPQYYQQSQKAYRSEWTNVSPPGQTFKSVQARLNKAAEMSNRVELLRYVNPVLTGSLTVGFNHEWYHDSQQIREGELIKESFETAIGAWLTLNRSLRFLLSLNSSLDVRNPRPEESLFTDRTTQYVLMTFWTIR
jgi:hypothetical protein